MISRLIALVLVGLPWLLVPVEAAPLTLVQIDGVIESAQFLEEGPSVGDPFRVTALLDPDAEDTIQSNDRFGVYHSGGLNARLTLGEISVSSELAKIQVASFANQLTLELRTDRPGNISGPDTSTNAYVGIVLRSLLLPTDRLLPAWEIAEQSPLPSVRRFQVVLGSDARLVSDNQSATGIVTSIRLTTVPEPTSAALVGIASTFLLGFRRPA